MFSLKYDEWLTPPKAIFWKAGYYVLPLMSIQRPETVYKSPEDCYLGPEKVVGSPIASHLGVKHP